MKLFKIPMFVTSLFGLGLLSSLDTQSVQADYVFGTPTNLGPKVNGPSGDHYSSVSVDELELYFGSYRSGGFGDCDIYVAKRVTTDAEWEEPTNLGHLINSSAHDGGPCLSPDGLSLYFGTLRGNGAGMVTRRESRSENWGTPEIVYTVEELGAKGGFLSFSSDNLEMYGCEYYVFDPAGFGLSDLWVWTRSSISDAWSVPQNLGPIVNSPAHDRYPRISADGLALFFSSDRPGGYGDNSVPIDKQDIWVTTRATKNDDWGTPMNLGPMVNTSASDNAPSISADGQTLYFSSRRPGGQGDYDLWQVSIDPVVDFNDDGIVDSLDVCIMIDHWGTDEPLCDIGPMPWGDGVVDVEDLIVLAEHLLPVFPAHWKLDETEGNIAYDSAGEYDSTLNGNPLWQPDSGKKGGALLLNGINDYISTPFILDAAKGSISVFAWIKGGEPGQVIVSQTNGTTWGGSWLYADSSNGSLATALMDPQPALVSESVITDGAWHHIGLVWDKSYRYLYVDGVEVARDAAALSYTMPCDGGLYLGAGKTLETGSFFSDLIDDVRIYRRALRAEEIVILAQ